MTKLPEEMEVAAGKRARWTQQLGEWKRSGQTQRVFCAEHGLALSTFQRWRARLAGAARGAKGSASFLPIALGADRSAGGAVIEIELRTRTRVRLEGEAALRAVDRLVSRIR